MTALLEAESRLTDRLPDHRCRLPSARRCRWKSVTGCGLSVQPDGQVVLTRAAERDADDPALEGFLDFSGRPDISRHPEHLQALDAGLAERNRGAGEGCRYRPGCTAGRR